MRLQNPLQQEMAGQRQAGGDFVGMGSVAVIAQQETAAAGTGAWHKCRAASRDTARPVLGET